MNKKIILKNTCTFLYCHSFWSNYTYYNKNLKYNKNTFLIYNFDNNIDNVEEIICEASPSINNQIFDFMFENQKYKITLIIKTITWPCFKSNNYNHFDNFLTNKINKTYDLIISLQTSIFIIFFCCRSTRNKKLLWNGNGNLLKKNTRFMFNNAYYRIGKIEEYNKKTSLIINNDIRMTKTISMDFSKFIFKRSTMNINDLDVFTIIYDIESMSVNGRHYPYMIYAKITSLNWPCFKLKSSNLTENIDIYSNDYIKQILNDDSFKTEMISHENQIFYAAEMFYEQLTTSNIVDQFINWIYKIIKQNHSIIQSNFNCRLIGFNNHRFDNNFILQGFRKWKNFKLIYNKRFNKVNLIKCILRISNNTINFYVDDMIKLLPETTLMKACKDYQIENSKIDFDIVKYNNLCSQNQHIYIYSNNIHSFINDEKLSNEGNIFNIIKHYCKLDVDSTCELYLKISDLIFKLYYLLAKFNIRIRYLNFFNYISIPQMAFDIFKDIAINENFNFGRTKDEFKNEFIITSCIGGRVNYGILGEYYSDNIKYMDVTSEYPLSMTAPFPSFKSSPIINPNVDELNKTLIKIINSRNEFFNKGDYKTTTYFSELFFGIFKVDLYPPKNKIDLICWAPIPIKIEGRNFFKNCKQKDRIINSIHIRTLIYAGWNVIIKQDSNNILFTSTEKIFLPFISLIGAMKTHYTPINKSFAKLCKLVMNSVAGKLAQKPTANYYKNTSESTLDGFSITQNETSTQTDFSTSLHYLSSYVTGYANWILYSTAYKLSRYSIYNNINERAGLLLYTDTDSIIYDSSKTNYNDFVISEQLGRWNDSRCDFDITWKEEHPNEIKKVIVIARKSYALFNNNNEPIDIKLKGIHSKQAKQFNYQILKQVCSKEYQSETIRFQGLRQDHFTSIKDIYKKISETTLVKTLNLESSFNLIKHPLIKDNYNNNNFNQTWNTTINCSNYLVFTQADGE